MRIDEHCAERLAELEARHLRRRPRTYEALGPGRLGFDQRPLLSLSSNDYLGLAQDPRLAEAAAAALRSDGAGAGASRLICGTRPIHRRLEADLAAHVGAEAALLFSSGYVANLGVLQALVAREDLVLSDRLNHASLIDGARLSRATVRVYDHADPDAARALLARHRAQHPRAWIVTDAVFSMDGDRAPVRALRDLADDFDAYLVVDEAHSLGVLGPRGRGLCAERGVHPDVLVGTLGKALGSMGAFAAAAEPVVRFLENRARGHVFSTAPAPAVAAAAAEGLRISREADPARARLLGHAARLREGLAARGYRVPPSDLHIVPVLIGDPADTTRLADALLGLGVLAHAIRPPTVPNGTSRLRLTPMATHADADIDGALEAFSRATAPSVGALAPPPAEAAR